jgi:hypothetical protein
MKRRKQTHHFVVCVQNEGYSASLELRKVYELLPDSVAAAHGLLRVKDESGESYLYPKHFFLPIRLPELVEKALTAAR